MQEWTAWRAPPQRSGSQGRPQALRRRTSSSSSSGPPSAELRPRQRSQPQAKRSAQRPVRLRVPLSLRPPAWASGACKTQARRRLQPRPPLRRWHLWRSWTLD
eukprot:Amastigsp_a27977_4.p4 type:complete len:103 gc:universal Amastigsp_a27977_4:327-19(-)